MTTQREIKINHDGIIRIATGRSRKDKNWINRELKWSELLDKLSQTVYTRESVEEYKSLPKSEQDGIKDVGGFVGGSLKGGRRKNDALEYRSLITLDADFAEGELWEKIKGRFNFSCCMYSTHKHSKAKPRYRIVLPLKRTVTPEEYQALSRKVACNLGLEMFDDTTYEPARMMYWPSTSRDGVYEFYYQDGEWLSPDDVLGSYLDWRNAVSWPMSKRSQGDRESMKIKQGSPGEKLGAAGAFCRTYSIPRAIEKFLGDVYEASADKNRYTYKRGTTTGGLAIYDEGDYAYSFHGTDPAAGKLLNAFDLVRIHKFSHLDEAAKEGTPSFKLPSSEAMKELAMMDEEVKITLGSEKLKKAGEAENRDIEDMKWLGLMEVDKHGKYLPTRDNIVKVLENDPSLRGRIGYNEFSLRVVKIGELPWSKLVNGENGDLWEDSDDAALRCHIEKFYGISCPQKIDDARMVVQGKNSFHPVKNYLNSLAWDGVKRAETLFIDYLGAEDCPYTRAVTRKMLAAACARVFEPGIKFDYMLVLTGGQGAGKGQVLRLLGGRWYSDSIMTINGKEGFEQLQGVWILEMGELSALKRTSVEHIKQYISKGEDYFRPAYGKHVLLFQRQCVIFGTTNDLEFLKDQTGNRRFWPVAVSAAEDEERWRKLTQGVVDQIWAEAYEIYKNGEELYLKGDLEREAIRRQEYHTETSINEGLIIKYLELLLPEEWERMSLYERRSYIHSEESKRTRVGVKGRTRVCAAEIWTELLKGELKDSASKVFIRDIHASLSRIEGWKPYGRGTGKLRFSLYGPQKAYIRLGGPEDV